MAICIIVKISLKDKSNAISNEVSNDETQQVDNGDSSETAEIKETFKGIKVGDTVTFGTYQGEDIEWRVLRMSDDKKEAVLVSKYILCMKAFDTAEGGKYNEDENGVSYYSQESEADTNMELQVQVRGNSNWKDSNIRTWLNSADEVVRYEDQKPIVSAMIRMDMTQKKDSCMVLQKRNVLLLSILRMKPSLMHYQKRRRFKRKTRYICYQLMN